MCPCRALNVFFVFFCFPPDFWVLYFWRCLGLKEPHIFGEEKKKKSIRERLGRGTVNTCAKFRALTRKNGVDILTFVRLSAKITACHRNNLVLEFIRFWALILTYYWSYAVSSSIFCAKLSTSIGAPGSGWSRKKWPFFFFLE